jgi:hypothetical protein
MGYDQIDAAGKLCHVTTWAMMAPFQHSPIVGSQALRWLYEFLRVLAGLITRPILNNLGTQSHSYFLSHVLDEPIAAVGCFHSMIA